MINRSIWSVCFALAVACFALPQSASAIPAFARQTGMACASCHVGSFGPQLTKMGRMFKVTGYTMGEKQDLLRYISGIVQGGSEHTTKPVQNPDVGKPNNNLTVDQVSLFYGGQVTSNIGLMTQVTYSPNDKTVALDNTDLRFAGNTTVAGQGLIYGVSVNNNPTMQDLWQSTPVWGYPYLTPALAPSPSADGYISALSGQVMGVGAYGLWNDLVYVEYSRYTMLSNGLQKALGNGDLSASDHLSNAASYWRLALQHDFGPHYVSIGTYGFDANRYPGNNRDQGTDNFYDAAIDGTWQFTAGKNSWSFYASALHEKQNLRATYALGGSVNPKNSLDVIKANLAYYYDDTYGLTVGRFSTTGTADSALYDSTDSKPDSRGYVTQFDISPFGKSTDIAGTYRNLRFFIQYTAYDKFNGAAKNYDGTGRNASDNNTTFAGIWAAY